MHLINLIKVTALINTFMKVKEWMLRSIGYNKSSHSTAVTIVLTHLVSFFLSSKKKHCVIYGKWTECMWSVDPHAYDAHKKAEKKGDNKKHKNVSSVCVAAASVFEPSVCVNATFNIFPLVLVYLIWPRLQAASSPPGKLASRASKRQSFVSSSQCGFCVQFVETSVKDTNVW